MRHQRRYLFVPLWASSTLVGEIFSGHKSLGVRPCEKSQDWTFTASLSLHDPFLGLLLLMLKDGSYHFLRHFVGFSLLDGTASSWFWILKAYTQIRKDDIKLECVYLLIWEISSIYTV